MKIGIFFTVIVMPLITIAQLQFDIEAGRLKEGPELIVLGKGTLAPFPKFVNLNTSKELELRPGDSWKIIDTILENDGVNKVILESKKVEKVELKLPYPWSLNQYFMRKDDADLIVKKYGKSIWNYILKGQVVIGWSKKLCELSWGRPNDINKTISNYGVNVQWVYYGGYLYFENGKLITIQN